MENVEVSVEGLAVATGVVVVDAVEAVVAVVDAVPGAASPRTRNGCQ